MTPKVLLVGNFLSSHGKTPQLCEQLASRLEMAGWQVTTTSDQPKAPLRLLDMVLTVATRRRHFDIVCMDVFSGRGFRWAEIVSGLLEKFGKPIVMVLHGGGLPAFAKQHPDRVSRVLTRATRVLAPSGFLAEKLRYLRSDIEVLRNGLDLAGFEFRLRGPAEPRLIWVRAFHQIYAPRDAVEVLRRVREMHPEATLAMLGAERDGTKGDVLALAKSYGLEQAIEFPGSLPLEQVPSYLHKADIFINTSTVDNAPRSVVEAMACGLCVVSTDVGGVRYLIQDGSDGLLVPIGEPELMADAVLKVIADPSLARSLSENAHRQANLSDWSVIMPQWRDLLGQL